MLSDSYSAASKSLNVSTFSNKGKGLKKLPLKILKTEKKNQLPEEIKEEFHFPDIQPKGTLPRELIDLPGLDVAPLYSDPNSKDDIGSSGAINTSRKGMYASGEIPELGGSELDEIFNNNPRERVNMSSQGYDGGGVARGVCIDDFITP